MASQLSLEFDRPRWGGARAGAGRKRTGRHAVPHRIRPRHRGAHPVHVTMRARAGLPPFRERALYAAMRGAIARASTASFRVVAYSVQTNHVHFVVEAHDAEALARGMKGLNVRLARAVNRVLGVRGQVWRERFHRRELTTPRAVRNALLYVLMNARKHGARLTTGIDPFSSAPWFEGFRDRAPRDRDHPVVAPRTWLARIGWRRRGLIALHESPRLPG